MAKTYSDVYNDKGSYVARDRIWRDHIDKITVSARKWPQNWGFLNSKSENAVYPHKKPNNPPNDNNSSNHQPQQVQEKQQQQQQQQQQHHKTSTESPRRVPMTTSKMIGWRSGDRTYQLEKYGPYSKGKQSITKSFQWPTEACE